MVAEAAGLGRIGVLVLSAAIESFTPVVDLSDDEWDHVLDVDLKGPFLCMRAAIPHMVDGGGAVIALGSTLGLIVAPGHPAYCASKGALAQPLQAGRDRARSRRGAREHARPVGDRHRSVHEVLGAVP